VQTRHSTKLGLPEDKFFIFFRSKNKWLGEPLARVYIHLRMDAAGTAALGGLHAIFRYLQTASPSVLQSFCRFKICSLQSLSEFADSVVMWTSSLEASRALAEALSGPLRPFTAPSIPTGVKRICDGIGISTEPETELAFGAKRLAPPIQLVQSYSYGTHRSALIARGLYNARNGNSFPDAEECVRRVALEFSSYGVQFMKPYRTGT